ncbi:hypothetical protein CPB83DRAFT_908456 [Crepidotus variabilis]|uniref:Uncharacterized protein n=1 Tax=Crepidotus variabilis TaxID=179855 RepID=A0A9P6ECF3_9AGAR|nr:hypothetical protein CPB83DRAFT_908456 [Crepidotus variabilis]
MVFEKILNALDTIYQMAQYYNQTTSPQHHEQTTSKDWLLLLYNRIHRLDTLIRRSQYKTQVAAVLLRIDKDVPNPYNSSESVLENGPDLDLDDNNNLKPEYSMTCFVYRIVNFNIYISRLIEIAKISRFKDLFHADPEIRCCPEMMKNVNVKPQHIVNKLPKATTIVASTVNKGTKVPVHAELKIFVALLQEAFKGKTPYWLIGVSELLCVGCYTLMNEAFSRILQRYPHTLLSPLTIPGSHGRIHPWTAPDLSFATEPLDFNMEREIRRHAK